MQLYTCMHKIRARSILRARTLSSFSSRVRARHKLRACANIPACSRKQIHPPSRPTPPRPAHPTRPPTNRTRKDELLQEEGPRIVAQAPLLPVRGSSPRRGWRRSVPSRRRRRRRRGGAGLPPPFLGLLRPVLLLGAGAAGRRGPIRAAPLGCRRPRRAPPRALRLP